MLGTRALAAVGVPKMNRTRMERVAHRPLHRTQPRHEQVLDRVVPYPERAIVGVVDHAHAVAVHLVANLQGVQDESAETMGAADAVLQSRAGKDEVGERSARFGVLSAMQADERVASETFGFVEEAQHHRCRDADVRRAQHVRIEAHGRAQLPRLGADALERLQQIEDLDPAHRRLRHVAHHGPS